MQVKAKEIQEKYSSDPQKMNQEMMELYKTNNAFGGCFTSILQIIVILSIFFSTSKLYSILIPPAYKNKYHSLRLKPQQS